MSNHALKAISSAEKVLDMVQDTLAPLQLSINHWPAELRAIIWDAVADIASRRAKACRAVVGRMRNPQQEETDGIG